MTAQKTTTGRSRAGGQERNESAVSLAWLAGALGGGSAPILDRWAEARDGMRRSRHRHLPASPDSVSDPWLARGVRGTGTGGIAPCWNPPDEIGAWPEHDVTRLVKAVPSIAWSTRHVSRWPDLPAEAGEQDATVTRFLRRETEPAARGDVVRGQVRTWLSCAVGPLLRDVMLTPESGQGALTEDAAARLAIPRQIKLPAPWAAANEFAERPLDLLYNLEISPDGRLSFLDAADVRAGQGEAWRGYWAWLSADAGFGETAEALRLAARLMRSRPVVEGLLQTARSDDPELRMIAPAVARRWLLTLKAMAWLEDAARESWEHVRPKDLACFAFNAVRPAWPRRAVGISHRSSDAKRALRRLALWSSSRCAIDAGYVPSWETNTGMAWALYGATPAIVRLRSPGYEESPWCLREAELTRHLVERADFLPGRWVLDVDLADLGALDAAYSTWDRETRGSGAAPVVLPESPPPCQVWTPSPTPAWEAAMLRASAALRVINTMLAGADLTNRFVAEFLLGDVEFPGPAPTAGPGGWQAYRAIFRRFQTLCDAPPGELGLRLPQGYPAEQMAMDLDMLQRMPDLSTGTADLGDLLVAFEFLRTEWPLMPGDDMARFLAVDCRGLTRTRWARDERLSLQRGLLAIRTPVPVWIIQLAGQGVEGWGIPGDHPIFTEHFPGQFSWMLEGSLDRRGAQSLFPASSGLELSADVRHRCREGG
ncbi:hypothetical protein OG589_01715 [Sphaerisporangium sp. NBC_01403]|uniref:hypothetical protein n=1 Tax=Sphaerisporangium sp. NBC_01403 TaxID=2903599 RepID=UPI00324C017D